MIIILAVPVYKVVFVSSSLGTSREHQLVGYEYQAYWINQDPLDSQSADYEVADRVLAETPRCNCSFCR